jgi:hypothetical protein
MAFGGREAKKLEARRATSATRIQTTKRLDGRDRQIYSVKSEALGATEALDTQVNGELATIPNSILGVGDVGYVMTSGQRVQTLRYATTITTPRNLTLPSPGFQDVRDGDRVRVIRTASGSSLTIKDVLGNTIATVNSAGTFREVEYSALSGAWIPSASGSV